MKDISIIIVNFNTHDLLENCINSILSLNMLIDYEIIVVDNKSTIPGFLSIKDKYKEFENISFIQNNKNDGFGKGNNIGFKYSNSEFIMLLNSDTIVQKDIFTYLISSYKRLELENKVGAIGITLVNAKGEYSHSYGNFQTLWKKYSKGSIATNIIDGFKQVDIIIGADMFMRSSIFRELNGFDENIFLYEEEFELQYRMRKLGYVNFLSVNNGIIHLEGKSSNNIFHKKCSFVSMCYIYRKHLPLYRYILFRAHQPIIALTGYLRSIFTDKKNNKFWLSYLLITLNFSKLK